jgi:small-conductance mechanosensitive channel
MILKVVSLLLVIVAVVLLFPTIFGVDFSNNHSGWFIIGIIGIASALLYLAGNNIAQKDRAPSVKAFQHLLGGFFKILGIIVFVVAVLFYFLNRISTPELSDYYTINVGTLSILVVSTVLIIIGYFISRENK